MLIKGIYKNIENIPKIRNFILILIDSVVFITIPNLSFIFIGNLEKQMDAIGGVCLCDCAAFACLFYAQHVHTSTTQSDQRQRLLICSVLRKRLIQHERSHQLVCISSHEFWHLSNNKL